MGIDGVECKDKSESYRKRSPSPALLVTSENSEAWRLFQLYPHLVEKKNLGLQAACLCKGN